MSATSISSEPISVYRKKLDRRIDPIGAAPYADDEIHRDQHRLEERIEQDAVERDESTVDEPRLDQERRHVLRDPGFDDFPAGPYHKYRHQAVQQHEQHRDAIDTEQIMNVEAGNPVGVFDKLHAGRRRVEMQPQRQCHQEARQRAG
jgi:hypothetical protein